MGGDDTVAFPHNGPHEQTPTVLRTVDTWSGDPGFAVVAWGDALGIEREGWGWGKPSGTPNTLNMVNEHIYLFIRSII